MDFQKLINTMSEISTREKGGYNKITRDKPLWIAIDYGECSNRAVIGITDKLELLTKEID